MHARSISTAKCRNPWLYFFIFWESGTSSSSDESTAGFDVFAGGGFLPPLLAAAGFFFSSNSSCMGGMARRCVHWLFMAGHGTVGFASSHRSSRAPSFWQAAFWQAPSF